jgi:hypothetical protein
MQNSRIKKGDAMLFFYAGHGSRVEAPSGWLAGDGMIETICPCDERTRDPNDDFIHGIPDRTIDGLMRRLAFQKGDNIVCALSFLLWFQLIPHPFDLAIDCHI